jgi:hypothetical protein
MFPEPGVAAITKDPYLRHLSKKTLFAFAAFSREASDCISIWAFSFFVFVCYYMFHTSGVLSIVRRTLLVSFNARPSEENQTLSDRPPRERLRSKNVRYEKMGKEGIKRSIGEGVGGQEGNANVYVCRLMTECGFWRK